MQEQSRRSQEYRKGIGRARTLVRQVLGFFPGTINYEVLPQALPPEQQPRPSRSNENEPIEGRDKKHRQKERRPLTVSQARRQQATTLQTTQKNIGTWPVEAKQSVVVLPWLNIPCQPQQSFRTSQMDSNSLRQAHQAIRLLSTVYRSHLEHVVPNADRWLPRIETAVNELTKLIEPKYYGGQGGAAHPAALAPQSLLAFIKRLPLPNRWKELACQLIAKNTELYQLIAALTWIELTKPNEPDTKQLEWIDLNADLLIAITASNDLSLQTQLIFCQLSSDTDSGWLRFLMQVLTNPLIARQQASNCFKYVFELRSAVRQAIDGSKTVNTPEVCKYKITWQIDTLLTWMQNLSSIQRTVFSRLMSHFVTNEIPESDELLIMEIEDEEQRLRRLLKKIEFATYAKQINDFNLLDYLPNPQVDEASDLADSLSARPFWIGNILQLSNQLKPFIANVSHFRILEKLASCFKSTSGQFRTSLFLLWFNQIDHGYQFKSFCNQARYLSNLLSSEGVHEKLIDIWQDCISGHKRDWTIHHSLLWQTPPTFRRVLQVIHQLLYRENVSLNNDLLVDLMVLCDCSDDLTWNSTYARHRASDNHPWPADSHLFKLMKLLDPDCLHPRKTAQVISDNDKLKACLDEIGNSCPPGWLLDAVRFQVDCGNFQSVMKIGQAAMLLNCIRSLDKKLQGSVDLNRNDQMPSSGWVERRQEFSTELTWIENYPSALRTDLIALNATLGEDARKWAEHALGKDCPSRGKILAELSKLEQLSADNTLDSRRQIGIKRRSTKLQEWLRDTQTIDSRRLANLRVKIQNRLILAAAEDYEGVFKQELLERLKQFGMRQISPELLQFPYSQILPALLQLNEPHRTLGLQVLGKGMENPGMFLEEPANVRFLQRLNSRGIATHRWVKPQFVVQRTRRDGSRYTVGFAKRSLDIFLMGFHFQTCLSPNQFNFFSTIANVADVNKRVLYGTAEDGSIVGRCLVCLNNRGEIQSFHRYEHDAQDGFAEAVDEFLGLLAGAMGTVVSDSGFVPRLVVRHWYDDGCVAVVSSKESVFENELKPILEKSAADEAMVRCEQAVGSRHSVIEYLSKITDYIYDHRRNLAAQCIEWLNESELLKFSDCTLILTALAKEAGESHAVEKALTCMPLSAIRKLISRKRLSELLTMPPVANLLVDHNAVVARRLFLDTRPTNIRCDFDERDPTRCKALASIHLRLHRHRRAKQLAQTANWPETATW